MQARNHTDSKSLPQPPTILIWFISEYLFNLFIEIEQISIDNVLGEIAVFDSGIELFLVNEPKERIARENGL